MNTFLVCYLAIQNTFVPINSHSFMIESLETEQCDVCMFDELDDETEFDIVSELQGKYDIDESPILFIEPINECRT